VGLLENLAGKSWMCLYFIKSKYEMYDIAIIFLIPLVHDTRYVPLNFEKLAHFLSVAALLFPNSCRTSILHERLYLTL